MQGPRSKPNPRWLGCFLGLFLLTLKLSAQGIPSRPYFERWRGRADSLEAEAAAGRLGPEGLHQLIGHAFDRFTQEQEPPALEWGRSLLEPFLKEPTPSYAATLQLARFERLRGYPDRAAAALERLLAVGPEDPQVWIELVRAALDSGDLSHAFRLALPLTKLAPLEGKLWICRIQAEGEQAPAALASLKGIPPASLQGPMEELWREAQARAWLRTGDLPAAIQVLEEALPEAPQAEPRRRRLAELHLARGRPEEVLALFPYRPRGTHALLARARALPRPKPNTRYPEDRVLAARFESARMQGRRDLLAAEALFRSQIEGNPTLGFQLAREAWKTHRNPELAALTFELGSSPAHRSFLKQVGIWVQATGRPAPLLPQTSGGPALDPGEAH